MSSCFIKPLAGSVPFETISTTAETLAAVVQEIARQTSPLIVSGK
jgi:hypothetical protein